MRHVTVIGYGVVGRAMVELFSPKFRVTVWDPALPGYNDDNAKAGCKGAELAIICVPTPEGEYGEADVSAVEDALSWCDAETTLIKSTVPPGTTARLATKFKLFGLCCSPEYMGEPRTPVSGRYLNPRSALTHGFVIVGGYSAPRVLDFFAEVMPVDTKFLACTTQEAELAKYMENAYFAMKVTFANEFARICEAYGADYKAVRELWLNDPRVEPDHTMVYRDAPGFGGKCLPKDLAAIIFAAEAVKVSPSLLRAVRDTNERIRARDQ